MTIDVSLLNSAYRNSVEEESLSRLDGLYKYYHRQWWYRKQMFYHFKMWFCFLNGLALLIMALSMIIGVLWEKQHVVVAILTALGTLVKGWKDFKNFSIKMDMSRFAFTTHEKTLIELRTYVRVFPLDEFEGFLIKLQTMEDTITDLTQPIKDAYVKQYDLKFRFIPYQKEHKLEDLGV